MKSLNFKLISNSKEIINERVNYYETGNILKFKVNEDLYEYNKLNNVLIKKDSEKELTINFKEKLIIINLLSNNIKVDYPMEESSIKKDDDKVILNYTLESDETIENTIIIEF